MYVYIYIYIVCRDCKVDTLAEKSQQLNEAKSMIQKLYQEVRRYISTVVDFIV